MSARPNLVGKKFSRLTVLSFSHVAKSKAYWLCQCDCGNTLATSTTQMTSGNTSSCGCLRRERSRASVVTHGMSGTKEHRAWKSMHTRCYNTNSPHYHRYGGRGIKVWEGWRHDFAAFYEHIGPCSDPNYTLDRIDNDKDYEPGNVRWASETEQANNRSNNRNLAHNGKTQTIGKWADEIGISEATLRDRLSGNWTVGDAVSTPKQIRQRNVILVTIGGEQKTLKQIAKETGIPYPTLWWRYTHNSPLFG